MRRLLVAVACVVGLASPVLAAPTVRFQIEGESAASNTVVNVTGLSVGDAIMVTFAGISNSARDYQVTTDCVADASDWPAYGTYHKENGSTSARHVMLVRDLAVSCSGTIVVTLDESATHSGYTYSVIAFDCQPTCTDDDSDVFDNAGGSSSVFSAGVGEIDITAQAVATSACSTTGTVSITIPTGFSDFTGTGSTLNMQAYLLTTGASADQRGTWTDANQRAADCLIFAIKDGSGAATAAPRGTLMGVLP